MIEEQRPPTEPIPCRMAYEAWAATYDTNNNNLRDLDAAVLRGVGLPLTGKSVIEIGAGTGKNTVYLAAHAHSVLAIDFSPAMLEVARNRVSAENVRFIEHDLTRRWPVADDRADIVVGNLVLEHIAELASIFAEAYRTLKPNGLLFFCELHPYRQLRGAQAQFECKGRICLVEAHIHGISDYVNLAVQAGFELVNLGEWTDTAFSYSQASDGFPRLLSALFRRRDQTLNQCGE